VLLQNTHLGLGYLTEVEQFLSKAEELHEDFRWAVLLLPDADRWQNDVKPHLLAASQDAEVSSSSTTLLSRMGMLSS